MIPETTVNRFHPIEPHFPSPTGVWVSLLPLVYINSPKAPLGFGAHDRTLYTGPVSYNPHIILLDRAPRKRGSCEKRFSWETMMLLGKLLNYEQYIIFVTMAMINGIELEVVCGVACVFF